MKRWLQYAFRNLLRNRRRSIYTILAVAVGYAGINLFGGFTEYIFTNFRESFVYIEGNGHLAVFKSRSSVHDATDPLKNLLDGQELARIRAIVEQDTAVRHLSEVMTLTGFLSNGDSTTIYVGAAWIPSEKYAFQFAARGLMSRLHFFDGEPLSDDLPHGIGLSRGLAERLGEGIGSDVILMAATVQGRINAADASVLQFIDTAMELLEDKWVAMPLDLARTLYDTDGASRISLLIDERADLEQVRARLSEALRDAGLDVDVLTWRELSDFYVKVERMFDTIFLIVFVIVAAIIIMSVVNTLSMSVLERSREIGTLRAIGAKRGHIVWLFSLEGGLLGLLGCGAGLLLLGLSLTIFGLVAPNWNPPHVVRTLPLEIYIVPSYLGLSLLTLTVLAWISGMLPARRIARSNIVSALGHV